MSAPTAHDPDEIVSRLQRVFDGMARIGAEIAEIKEAIAAEAARRAGTGGSIEADPAVFTPRGFARRVDMSPSWVNDRIRDGTLPAVRVGTRWLLRRSDLVAGGWL